MTICIFFSHVYDFPLLNPIPYSKEENTEIHKSKLYIKKRKRLMQESRNLRRKDIQ